MRQLQYADVPLNKILSRSDFRKFDFLNPDSYLPMSMLYSFLQTVRTDQGVNHIGNMFYNDFQLNELGDFGEFITERPDLLTVISDGIKYESHIQTNTIMNIEISGPITKFSQVHLDPFSKGRQNAEDIAFAMAYKAFKMVLGKNWRPTSLHVPGFSIDPITHIVSTKDTNIVFGASYYHWFFETAQLSHKNLSMTEAKELSYHGLSNLSGHIQLLLNSLTEGYIPTRRDFSGFLNLSESTIVRTLNTEGTTYLRLLQKHLFLKTLDLMHDEKLQISEISLKLGYANTPNFIRAFKKWTNTTPERYRNQIL